ncbi:MAG: hypothetical protein AB7S78_12460 [Candidatus Omnitrophota bacterium]
MEFENKMPVRHVRDGYKGWISGTTKMKEIFTGNREMESQYCVHIPGEDKRRIAPGEDLELITDVKEFPEFVFENETHDENESWLHALGYQITDMDFKERTNILVNVAIPYRGERSVIFKLTSFMKSRATSPERIRLYYYALTEWNRDINFILSKYEDWWIKKHVKEIRSKLEKKGYKWKE